MASPSTHFRDMLSAAQKDAAPPAAVRKKPKKSAKTMFAGSDDSDSDEFE